MNTSSQFKIMTYNIHSGFGRDKAYCLDRIIEVIGEEQPDIVALQEVDHNLRRSRFDAQAKIIAEALDLHFHYCVNRNIQNGEYGIATLSRFPIQNKQRHDLSYGTRREPRGGLRTDLHIDPCLRLHLFNVHLGLSVRERQHQRRRLLSDSILLDEDLQDPVVVLGDFNDKPISVVHPKFRGHFKDVFDQNGRNGHATFRWGPVRFRLDHIYLNKQLTSLKSYIVKTPLTRIASDHLPVVSIVAVKS